MKLTFFGGAETVTGSKILLEFDYQKILIDCGLFQGLKELRLKNWEPLPVNPANINHVFLTHAHLDHSGYLPLLLKNGFKGKIYCTQATQDLTKIILLDSGKIQEEDTRRANKYKYTKHEPAVPLYGIEDAKEAITRLVPFEFNKWHTIDKNLQFQFVNSGHILGSAFVVLRVNEKIIVFSGDIGRKEPIILHPFEYIKKADYVVIESTYGNRSHKNSTIQNNLLHCINHTYSKGGVLIIPTFSVERAQEIIYLLSVLKRENSLPEISIYLDSPMGVDATEIYFSHPNNHKLSSKDIQSMRSTVQLISDVKASKAVVYDKDPKIVLAGSTPLSSLIESVINSLTMILLVSLLITLFSKSVPSKLISSISLPSKINRF